MLRLESTSFDAVGATTEDGFAAATTNNQGGENSQVTVTARNAGADYDNVKVVFRHDENLTGGGDEYVAYDDTAKELNIYIKSGTSLLSDVLGRYTQTASPTAFELFALEAVGDATGTLYSTDTGTLTGGVVQTGTDQGVALTGNYDEGDVLGTTGLTISSTGYGSKEFVSVKALSGTFQMVDGDGLASERDNGEDVDARINGIKAVSDGLGMAINTSSLDVSFTLDADVVAGSTLDFRVIEGGAQFQMGPDVVSNQQARLGIASVNTSTLGGNSGQLFQLRSGGSSSLANDTSMAAKIVEESIVAITTLRGRLGAFQKTTLETNINALNDTLEALTDAESSIRDADFAEESANLTRAQILVKSGTSVLGIANQNPQNVLSLLQ